MALTLGDLGLSDLGRLEALASDDEEARQQLITLRQMILTLAVENDQLRRKLFGPKSEKMSRAEMERQLLLFGDVLDELRAGDEEEPLDPEVQAELDALEEEAAREKEKEQPTRQPLPEHLPQETVTQALPADQCCPKCGGDQLAPLGHEESTEQLEWVPGRFKRVRHRREKRSCTRCCGIVTAPVAIQPIPKGIAGPGLLARLVVDKFVHHLPLYRQAARWLVEHGVGLAESTLCGWVSKVAQLLLPIYQVMVADVLKSKVIHTDDTSVRVQLKHSAREVEGKARLWPYVGDADHRHVVFHYTISRERDGPARFLAGFRGYLQADAYAGYDGIYAGGQVKEVGCWAHARRKVYECKEKDPIRAPKILVLIQQLFAVERRGKRLSSASRCALRKRESAPILEKLRVLIDGYKPQLLPKGPLAQAIGYIQNQWGALTRFLEDGDLAIDNNAAERAIRPIAVGRKNWLFVGSDKAGERAAILYSIVQSCRYHDVDPFAYLCDVLLRVGTQPADQMWELTPLAWKAEKEGREKEGREKGGRASAA